MRYMILAVFFLTLLSASSFAGEIPGMTKATWDVDDMASGQFCIIESAEVCVLTQSEEDCNKLEGVKVDTCPQSQSGE